MRSALLGDTAEVITRVDHSRSPVWRDYHARTVRYFELFTDKHGNVGLGKKSRSGPDMPVTNAGCAWLNRPALTNAGQGSITNPPPLFSALNKWLDRQIGPVTPALCMHPAHMFITILLFYYFGCAKLSLRVGTDRCIIICTRVSSLWEHVETILHFVYTTWL